MRRKQDLRPTPPIVIALRRTFAQSLFRSRYLQLAPKRALSPFHRLCWSLIQSTWNNAIALCLPRPISTSTSGSSRNRWWWQRTQKTVTIWYCSCRTSKRILSWQNLMKSVACERARSTRLGRMKALKAQLIRFSILPQAQTTWRKISIRICAPTWQFCSSAPNTAIVRLMRFLI